MCKMYKNNLSGSLGDDQSSVEWKNHENITRAEKLHLDAELIPDEVLALRVVFGHETLGVLAGVDGGWVELSMPERSRRGWWVTTLGASTAASADSDDPDEGAPIPGLSPNIGFEKSRFSWSTTASG